MDGRSLVALVGGGCRSAWGAEDVAFDSRELRGLIVWGELAPDQVLPSESDLLEAFQVSRNTLREALRVLESESLIQIRRGRTGGAVVQRPDSRSVVRYVSLLLQVRGARWGEVHEARLVIEPPVAARLVDIPPEEVGRLKQLHEAELAQLGGPGFFGAVAEFDQLVFELSGSKTIAVLWGIFRAIMASQVLWEGEASRRVSVSARLADLHGAFVGFVAGGDAELARECWVDYLSRRRICGGRGRGRPGSMWCRCGGRSALMMVGVSAGTRWRP